MENVVNNTEPMPSTPQGANGKWEWNEHTTARQRSVDGQEWLLKGAWRWVQEQKQAQAPLADKPIAFIANYYKPQSNERIGQVLNKLILVFAIVAGIAIITMLIL